MPYITENRKQALRPLVDQVAEAINRTPGGLPDGELNYAFTRLIQKTLMNPDLSPAPKPNYFLLERVEGLLGCCQKEFYRRLSAPYEDRKAEQNGDVYGVSEP